MVFKKRPINFHYIKEVISRDFGIRVLITLDRYDVRNRAGAVLFFILMTFSYLNFSKVVNCGVDPLD
jgi:hypothetical protein